MRIALVRIGCIAPVALAAPAQGAAARSQRRACATLKGHVKRKRAEAFGVEPSGQRRLRDAGAPTTVSATSLTLSDSTVQWLDAGAPRSATL